MARDLACRLCSCRCGHSCDADRAFALLERAVDKGLDDAGMVAEPVMTEHAKLEDDEIRIDLMRESGSIRSIRIVHLPTGLAVQDDGPSSLPIVERKKRLREKLLALLEEHR